MTFDYAGCTFNLLDTPGHQDFSEDTYRTLTAVDSAVMVIDAAKGIETQTRKLFEVCRLRNVPIITFVNKMDRDGRDPFELMDEIERDVTQLSDVGRYDVWHDRAVFHFLTDPVDRQKYVALVKRTIPVGGHLVIGTFAPDGPEKCSGLEVRRYDAAGLIAEFGPDFRLVEEVKHTHHTPAGKLQRFTFTVLRRCG